MDSNQTVNIPLLLAKLVIDEASQTIALSRLLRNRSWNINGESWIAKVVGEAFDWNTFDVESSPFFMNQTDLFPRKAKFFGQHQTANLFLPLARRFFKIFRPLVVFILARKPWTLFLRLLWGWNVLFILSFRIYSIIPYDLSQFNPCGQFNFSTLNPQAWQAVDNFHNIR